MFPIEDVVIMDTKTLFFRNPTYEEKELVYNYMYKYYRKLGKHSRKLKGIFGFVGVFFMLVFLTDIDFHN